MEDHLPHAAVIHDAIKPPGKRWTEALALTRQGGRWSQHLYSALGRRRGRLVEVHVVQSFDPEQETGPKGYLEDDEVLWRIEAVCFPLEAPPSGPFAEIGSTAVIHGRYCIDLPLDGMAWAVRKGPNPSDGSLLAEAYLLPWLTPKNPEVELRFTVDRGACGPSHADQAEPRAEWTDAGDGSRRWRRRVGHDLIELCLRFTGDGPVLNALPDRLLNSFWIIS